MAAELRKCPHCKGSHISWWGKYVAAPNCKITTQQLRVELFHTLLLRMMDGAEK